MADSRDTLFRYLTLLQLIPRYPGRIATPVLQEKLRERGFEVDIRSLQRDLGGKIARHFPLGCDDSSKPYRWYFDQEFHCDLPALNVPSALTLLLAEQYLITLLPPVVVDQLSPQFNTARRMLDGLQDNTLGQWAQRVRAIGNGRTMQPAPVARSIWESVSEALMCRRVLSVDYLSRSQGITRPFNLHTQGLVSRDSVTYLLAIVNDYADVRQFALHRILRAEMSDMRCRTDDTFDVDAYINSGALGFLDGETAVELIADVSPQTAWMLSETPLSQSQYLSALPDTDWQRLIARVPDEQQTLWWLMGLGANVDVHSPRKWREAIADNAKTILERMRG